MRDRKLGDIMYELIAYSALILIAYSALILAAVAIGSMLRYLIVGN